MKTLQTPLAAAARAATTATTSAVPAKAWTADDYRRAAAALEAAAAARLEPFANWMRNKGTPPETHILVLPDTMRDLLPAQLPGYVRVSTLIKAPLILSRAELAAAGGAA